MAGEDELIRNANYWVRLWKLLDELGVKPDGRQEPDAAAAEFIRTLVEQCRVFGAQRDELKQVLINAGHALCALEGKNDSESFRKAIVDRQIHAIVKLTGHDFRRKGKS